MYSQFFGFKLNPFSQIPLSDSDYLPFSHRLVLQQLDQAINKSSSGLFLLLGPIGIGKTCLIKAFLDDRHDGIRINDLTPKATLQSSISASTDLAMMLKSIPYVSSSNISKQQPTIFFLDNADLYDEALLQSLISMISERNENNIPTLLILTGQSPLEFSIQNIQFAISSTLEVNSFYLKSFDNVEIKEYINHRLYLVDHSTSLLFSDAAIRRIAVLSKGLPRVINTLCGVSIFQASIEELYIIKEELVDKASAFCFLAKDVEEGADLQEPVEVNTEQIKPESLNFTEKKGNFIQQKPVSPNGQPYPVKSKESNVSVFDGLRTNKPNSALKKDTPIRPGAAERLTNDLLSLSSVSQSIRRQSNKVDKPVKRLSKSLNFSLLRTGSVFFAVTSIILLFIINFSEQLPETINSDIKHSPLNTADISDLVDDNNALLITKNNQNSHANQVGSTVRKVNEPSVHAAKGNIDLLRSYKEFRDIDKGLLANDQKKNNALIKMDNNLKPIKKNKVLLASAKKHTILSLKPSEKRVQVRNRKANTMTSKIIDAEELAVKKRASARYKLTQKGIRYDVDSYFLSAEKGNNELLKLFLAANMPIDIRDKSTRNTILIKATKKGFLDVVTTALDNQAKVNRQNREGKTALITAVANGHYAISHKLLAYGANVHIRDNNGWDALLFAVKRNELAIVKELLKHGANKNTKDSAGVSALLMAKNNKQYEMVSLLEMIN